MSENNEEQSIIENAENDREENLSAESVENAEIKDKEAHTDEVQNTGYTGEYGNHVDGTYHKPESSLYSYSYKNGGGESTHSGDYYADSAEQKKEEESVSGADPAGKERCKCRIVPEDDAKRVILTAFEKLPELQGNLIRMLNEIRLVDLPRIDCRIQMLREDSPADVHPEERKLVLERAELLHREMLVRFLLELSDEIKVSENLKQNDTVSAACFDSEDFFYRTRHPLPEGLLDSQGRFTRFDDLLVIRYLDRVVVEEKRYQVCFKAGISVFVC